MLAKTVQEMETFFTALYAVAKESETRFVLTVSENEDNFPEFLSKYAHEA